MKLAAPHLEAKYQAAKRTVAHATDVFVAADGEHQNAWYRDAYHKDEDTEKSLAQAKANRDAAAAALLLAERLLEVAEFEVLAALPPHKEESLA